MDQKHAMLYPSIDANAVPYEQRARAAAAMGLPVEPPPTYDAAMASGPSSSASASARATSGKSGQSQPSSSVNSNVVVPSPTAPQPSPVITEQPRFPVAPAPQVRPPQMLPQSPQLQTTENTTVTVSVPHPLKLGPNPSAVTCPVCGVNKTTRMCYTPNSRTHLCALLLCLVGWCCCACCVPYCMDSCRTGNHYCSKCNTYLGSYHPRRIHRN